MVSFVVDGDVQIHDVTALQLARIGNAVADHFIDGTIELDQNRKQKKIRADAFGEEIIV